MPLNSVLLLFVAGSAGLLAVQSKRLGVTGWMGKGLCCFFLSVAGLVFHISDAAIPVLLIWIGLVVVPSMLRGYAERLARTPVPSAGTVRQAVSTAWIAAMLHPFDGWRDLPHRISEVASIHEANAVLFPPKNARSVYLCRPRIVVILVALNIFCYGVTEVSGGSMDPSVLLFFGSLSPELVWVYGEWWRIVAAMFLHAGLLHLGMNMLALLSLGPALEEEFGSWRFLGLYLGSGIGSMGLLTLLWWMGIGGDGLVVGASGAIMGLVGVMGAQLLRRVRRGTSTAARHQLRSIAMVVLFQTILDVLSPEISGTAHIAGLLCGFGLGLLGNR